MSLTLEEEINHCLEVAEANEMMLEYDLACTDNQKEECKAWAEEYRQLAEWLSELNAYRKAEKEIEQTMDLDDRDDIDEGKCRGLFLATCIIQHYKNEEVTADDK